MYKRQLPDFFSNRFHEKKKIIMTICSLILIIFFSAYAAQCLLTCGKLFSNLFGFSYGGMMIVAAVFVLAYTFLGGYLAESASDFMQGVVMVTVLVLILILSVVSAGGLNTVCLLYTSWAYRGSWTRQQAQGPDRRQARPAASRR